MRAKRSIRWIAWSELLAWCLAGAGWWLGSRGLLAFGLTLALVLLVVFWPIKLLADLDRRR